MSTSRDDIGVIINLNSNYSDFQFTFVSLSVFLSVFPFAYIIPTCFVVYQIIKVFIDKGIQKHDETVNRSVFLVIILSQFTCLCFFLFDFAMIRFPSTGILTTWCQRNPPNFLLTAIFIAHEYFTYPLMIYPVLLTVVRYIPIHYPHKHREFNNKILCYSIPFIHIYPVPFLFIMFPALGVCRQFKLPYPFGSAFIHFIDSWHNMINMPFEMLNTFFWLIVFLISNFVLHRELRRLSRISQCHLHAKQSAKYRKAELSLTITTGCMILTYAVNLIFEITFLIDYQLGSYTSFLRPYGNDLEACVVPWVFYLTHPAFKTTPGSRTSSSGQQRTTLT